MSNYEYLSPIVNPIMVEKRSKVIQEQIKITLIEYFRIKFPDVVFANSEVNNGAWLEFSGLVPVTIDSAGCLFMIFKVTNRECISNKNNLVKVLASLPYGNFVFKDICFAGISSSNVDLLRKQHNGYSKIIQQAELTVKVDYLKSNFSNDIFEDKTSELKSNWKKCSGQNVLPIITEFFNEKLNLDFLQNSIVKGHDGCCFDLLVYRPMIDIKKREFQFVFLADFKADKTKSIIEQLLALLPLEDKEIADKRGNKIFIKSMYFPMELKSDNYNWWGENRVGLNFFIDCAIDVESSIIVVENSNILSSDKVKIDFIDLERELTKLIAEEVGLEVDCNIWRGRMPLNKSGVRAKFIGQHKTENTRQQELSFEIILKDTSRDNVLNKISQLEYNFPKIGCNISNLNQATIVIYDTELLKESDSGADMYYAILKLKIIGKI